MNQNSCKSQSRPYIRITSLPPNANNGRFLTCVSQSVPTAGIWNLSTLTLINGRIVEPVITWFQQVNGQQVHTSLIRGGSRFHPWHCPLDFYFFYFFFFVKTNNLFLNVLNLMEMYLNCVM